MIRDEGEDRLADLVDAQLRYLQGRGPEPDLAGWVGRGRAEAVRILELVEVLADSLPSSPPIGEDPVAIELGLLETIERYVSVAPDHDLITVRVEEACSRFGGAVQCEPVAGDIGGVDAVLFCRSLVETVLVAVCDPREEPRTFADTFPVFRDRPDLTAVAFTSLDAARAAVVTYGESVGWLVPAEDWIEDRLLEWGPLEIVLGRHFDRSLPRWDEVNRLSADALDSLVVDTSGIVESELNGVTRLRPRLAHKRDAREFVIGIEKARFETWVDVVRSGRASGEDLTAEIVDLCRVVAS